MQDGSTRDPDQARAERVGTWLRAVAAPTPEAAAARLIAELGARQAHRAAAPRVARSVAPGDALPAGAARAEIYRGEESAARRVIEIAGPIVTQAASWDDLHARLAGHGLSYAAKGSGAVFIVDGLVLKASTCRAASRARLEARFGPFRPGARVSDPTMAKPSPRPAPGVDRALFTAARDARIAADAERVAYDAVYPELNGAPMLKTVLVGPAPRAAPSARALARRTGRALPRLAPVRRPDRAGVSLRGLLELYHAGVQADRYRVVAERPSSPDPDRLVLLSPRPMTEVAQGWAALERAAGAEGTVYLEPVSDDRHHVVFSGLRVEQVARLRAAKFEPSLVLRTRSGRYGVVLTVPNEGRPYERAALAEVSEHLRLSIGVARERLGLRIDDPDPPDTTASGDDARPARIYAQVVFATGAQCVRLARLIRHRIGVFAKRFGLGPGSRLGRSPDRDGTEQHADGVAPHADAPLYWAHRGDLLARWQGRWPDPSRVDALIARRLRGTGHDEAAVAGLITACAPMVPRIGRHAWAGYGRRAAAHAFRADADDSGWAFDRSTPAMWRELEQAVREREQAARKDRQPEQPMPPTMPDLPAVSAATPSRKKPRVGTTEKGKGANKRDDDWWD